MTHRSPRDPHRWLRLRLTLVAAGFGLAGLALMGRAVDLQWWQSERLTALAQREFIKKVEITPRRGIVYDRQQQELAVSLDTDSVYARPLSVKTPRETGRLLALSLGLSLE